MSYLLWFLLATGPCEATCDNEFDRRPNYCGRVLTTENI